MFGTTFFDYPTPEALPKFSFYLVTMPTTRAEEEKAFIHLLENVFGWTKEATEAYQALIANDYSTITDITTLEVDEIDELESEKGKRVPMKQKKMLKHALLFYNFEIVQHASKRFDAYDWIKLDNVHSISTRKSATSCQSRKGNYFCKFHASSWDCN